MGILLICGSLRSGSPHAAVLATAASLSPGSRVYQGVDALPYFNPDDDGTAEPVVRARAAVDGAEAVLFSTPEYLGAVPGALKNLLEWTVAEFHGKPVGWVGAGAALRGVLEFLGTEIVPGAAIEVAVRPTDVGPDGEVHPTTLRAVIADAVSALEA